LKASMHATATRRAVGLRDGFAVRRYQRISCPPDAIFSDGKNDLGFSAGVQGEEGAQTRIAELSHALPFASHALGFESLLP